MTTTQIPERASPKSPRQGIRSSATEPLPSTDAHAPASGEHSPSPPESQQASPRQRHHSLAGAAHAVMFTQNWKPGITRAQSWTPEDRKRSVQMSGLMEEEIPEGYSQYSER